MGYALISPVLFILIWLIYGFFVEKAEQFLFLALFGSLVSFIQSRLSRPRECDSRQTDCSCDNSSNTFQTDLYTFSDSKINVALLIDWKLMLIRILNTKETRIHMLSYADKVWYSTTCTYMYLRARYSAYFKAQLKLGFPPSGRIRGFFPLESQRIW